MSTKNFTDAGIPRDFAEKLVSKYHVKHNAPLTPIDSKPRKADVEGGDMVISVWPSGEVIAAMINSGSRREYKYLRLRYTTDGEFKSVYTDSIAEATSGMTKRRPMFMLRHQGISWRNDKPTPDEIERRRTRGDTLAGSVDDIFSYMNKTFMPRLKPKMEQMVDEIFSNLRRLPKDVDRYRHKLSSYSRNQREEALRAASAIEDIMEKGFTSNTLYAFPELQGVKGIMSDSHWGTAWEKTMDTLEDLSKTDPLARAKWAKTLLDSAQAHWLMVMDMIDAPVISALSGE